MAICHNSYNGQNKVAIIVVIVIILFLNIIIYYYIFFVFETYSLYIVLEVTI